MVEFKYLMDNIIPNKLRRNQLKWNEYTASNHKPLAKGTVTGPEEWISLCGVNLTLTNNELLVQGKHNHHVCILRDHSSGFL